jgi:ABC-type phosphate transport system substrate-binding protein
MRTRVIIFCAAALLLMTGSINAEMTIIANPDVPGMSLSASEVKEIFLGKRLKWPDNSRVNIVLSGDAGLHEAFLKNYIGRSPTQFEMHWRNMLFTGQAQIPVALKADQEIINFVANTPGGVGYVSSRPESNNIKVLSIK